MSVEHKALVRRWFQEVWNQGRSAAIDELLADQEWFSSSAWSTCRCPEC